jgi:bifunctional DNase/RNase
MPIVLLKTADGSRYLPIWIGHPEAAAILMKLQNATTPRPMTHDLFVDVLSQLDVRVVRITVTELRENTFYAQITVAQDGQEVEIDSRPSDAIALAIRTEAPIFADERVIEESGIEFEAEDGEEPVPGEPVSLTQEQIEEVTSKFKSFLEDVTPEQFAEGEEE